MAEAKVELLFWASPFDSWESDWYLFGTGVISSRDVAVVPLASSSLIFSSLSLICWTSSVQSIRSEPRSCWINCLCPNHTRSSSSRQNHVTPKWIMQTSAQSENDWKRLQSQFILGLFWSPYNILNIFFFSLCQVTQLHSPECQLFQLTWAKGLEVSS